MRVLVTGGAGFIGSHTVLHVVAAGHEPVIVDDFRNANPSVVDRLARIAGRAIEAHELDLTDRAGTHALLAGGRFDAVIHFAALKAVGESVDKPLEYYENNLGSTLSLVAAMGAAGVRLLVFSSSATVYGADAVSPFHEQMPVSATNPYGWTKVMIEQILRDVAAADSSWRIGLLRYFNPVGAHESGLIGEDPKDIPNNLMPRLAAVAAREVDRLRVFGGDYPTPDGTGVRDYVHVEDVAAGHVSVLDHLARSERPVDTWNLGTGRGTSVLELVHAFERATGQALPYEIAPRRPGDVAVSYADVGKVAAELGWTATRSVDQMCVDAWRWKQTSLTAPSR